MSRHHFSDHPSYKPEESSMRNYWSLPTPDGWLELRVGEAVAAPPVNGPRRILQPNLATRAKWALHRLETCSEVHDLLEIRRLVEDANPGCTPAEIDLIFIECFKIKMKEAAEKRKNK